MNSEPKVTMKKVLAIFIGAVILIGLVYYLNNLSQPKIAKAGASENNVYGWAWAGGGEIGGSATATIGWISFNCTDREAATGKTCLDANNPAFNPDVNLVDYGVNIDPKTGLFSGYAWAGGTDSSASGTIGWIDFAPSGPYPTAPNYSACLDLPGSGQTCDEVGDYKVSGWARALVATSSPGGWDGWIKLNGTTTDNHHYGVSLNPVTREFEGWAAGWDDSTSTAVIGWISFNCKDGGYNEVTGEHYDICATSSYRVALSSSFNLPPTVASTTVTQYNYCFATYPPVVFSWVFSDPGDTQSAYQVQIDLDDNGSWDLDSGKISNSSNSYTTTTLPYGLTNADWRVRVWDSHNATSSWANGPNFSTPAHRYPWPDFTPSPSNGTVGQVITFGDNSTCYGVSCSYFWNFGDGSPIDNTNGTTTHTYTKTGTYKATLNITDDVGSCTSSKTIHIRAKLPWWREIIPK